MRYECQGVRSDALAHARDPYSPLGDSRGSASLNGFVVRYRPAFRVPWHPPKARKQATLETFDAVLADGAAVAEHAVSTRRVVNGGVSDDLPSNLLKVGALVVDAARIELATSALRTRRSPS
jgi:hypothetical protein